MKKLIILLFLTVCFLSVSFLLSPPAMATIDNFTWSQ